MTLHSDSLGKLFSNCAYCQTPSVASSISEIRSVNDERRILLMGSGDARHVFQAISEHEQAGEEIQVTTFY